MTDFASLSAAFSSAKTAFEIAKLIHASGSTLEQAETKLKLADLLGSLADVKMQLVEVQDDMAARSARIHDLEEALEAKDHIQRVNDAYYRVDAAGTPRGDPLCLRCWDADKRQRALIGSHERMRDNICPTCKTIYREGYSARIG